MHLTRCTKLIKLICHFTIIIVLSYFLANIRQTSVKKEIERFHADLRHLLIWTRLPGMVEYGQKYLINRKCHRINCYFTSNRSLFSDIRYFDGIIFNLQDLKDGVNGLPHVRAMKQKYIFAANDSADNYPVCDSVYENFFNWTWTYREDSIVRYKFFSVYNIHYDNPIEANDHLAWIKDMQPIDASLRSQLSTKSKAAAIFLDKCESQSKREIFLLNLKKELLKYNLTLDIYGKCGNMECKRKTMNPCYWKLRKIYYFYLAMEDSFAADFVTDSVLYGYKYNAVPIVYGGAEYRKYLPPNSYINAAKLGVDNLAYLMHLIIKNKERYFDYFNWRNHYIIKESTVLDACILCELMNNPTWMEHKIIHSNFRQWWNPYYDELCYSKQFLYFK
ncbi:hypothetical protein K1T71_011748 [Dendrolimus kikuchii]|uniref:Uncharacterized protein n=1 Tax=Dendrolimus kikuchii TaxID=765133 RepID=A0ACC1CLX5_9NEOP|nr:hypothetical protein K1T71_011748 [Dendrolimus kikuchii]